MHYVLNFLNSRIPYIGCSLLNRVSDGTGEWRQLLLDMQEIVDWLVRADQELTSQKPIGGDIETVQQQNDNHQVYTFLFIIRRTSNSDHRPTNDHLQQRPPSNNGH